ncbi:unnamed protein product [Mytilus edulis]|uniref:Phospholipase A2-like central domain-containing protein n=1 Tax=Mytilus edulis TaxID=6550 RepID=A0A8S3R8D6_MYTED|nr:unnamed protein product [Mytilus edulis]
MGIDLVLLMVLWILAGKMDGWAVCPVPGYNFVCIAARGSTHVLMWTSDGKNAMDTNQDLFLPDDLTSMYRIHFILKNKSDNVYFADELNKYGCWCAQNGTSYPVDELDRCCLEHQMCLKEILSKGCPLSSRYYSYEQCLIFKCNTYGEFVSIGYTPQPNCNCLLLTLIPTVETKSTSTSSSPILQKTPSVTVPTSTYQSTGQNLETDLANYSISSALKMRATILIHICVLQAVIVG